MLAGDVVGFLLAWEVMAVASAVLVLTDGYISYPAEEPPYAVLWGLVDGYSGFRPPYGTVVHVRT